MHCRNNVDKSQKSKQKRITICVSEIVSVAPVNYLGNDGEVEKDNDIDKCR